MSKYNKKDKKSQTDTKDLVTVTVADDIEEAKTYESLLKNDDIPVTVIEVNETTENRETGYALMVPEEYLDEAHVIIESQDAYDDFYDYAIEQEPDDDYDADVFDEEFQG